MADIILPAKIEMKNYTIVNPDGTESGTFTGHQPRQAALKACKSLGGTKDKPTTFKIREKGTKNIHVFKGYVVDIPTPEAQKRLILTPEAQKRFIKTLTIKLSYVEKICTEKVN